MKNAKKILVIDDDPKLLQLIREYLSRFNMTVETAVQPEEGLKRSRAFKPDLVILDVMMPGKDGFEVLKELRIHGRTPVIMLTARGELTDRVVGLELGADDYMPKPFEPRELVARIESVLRRSGPQENIVGKTLRSGTLALDLSQRSVVLKGKDLDLTTTEFETLAFFMKNAGIVLDRDRILEYLRGIECEAYNRSVDIAISRLRKKLGDSAEKPKFFKTVWGSGYLFTGKVMVHEK